jgi:sulfide dehydrogenase [flavocytochrome c] flavoprotein subunit
MPGITRRRFLEVAGGTTALALGATLPRRTLADEHRVVIVGGGAGGCIVAQQLIRSGAPVQVTLIEQDSSYHAPYMSNEVLSGARTIDSIRFSYDGLRGRGITVIHGRVTGIDPDKGTIVTADGRTFGYDRLVLSPGIEFQTESIEGYPEAGDRMPHAWGQVHGEGHQILLLRNQVQGMRKGGTVVITVPARPYRCPAGPYERASQIAAYLSVHNPTAKILILDSQYDFDKQRLFMDAWQELYPGMIDWLSARDTGGGIRCVNARAMEICTGVETFTADVANIIPPQSAGRLALDARLADETGWCPVDPRTFESLRMPGVHVIGDSCTAPDLTKTAQAANSQAKVCAASLLALMAGREPVVPRYMDQDYSVLAPDYALVSAAVYRLSPDGERIVQLSGGHGTPHLPTAQHRRREVEYAHSWYNNIAQEMFE